MIQPALHILLTIEPVFAYLIMQSRIFYDVKQEFVNTAAVAFDETGKLVFYINPEYYLNLPLNQQVNLLEHECSHVFRGHLIYFRNLYHQAANIAMDVEVDQKTHVRYRFARPLLPITVDELNHMPDNLNFIPYYEELLKHKEKLDKYQNPNSKESQSKNGNKQGSQASNQNSPHSNDEHNLWLDMGMTQEAVKINTKIAVNQAYQELKYANGKISEELELAIKELLKPSKVNWTKHLENLIGNVISNNRQQTRTRPNKKLEYLAPGTKDGHSPNLLFFVDISGSHVDELYIKSFENIKTILEDYQDDLRVFFFSDGVFDESVLVNSDLKTIPKKPGSGGTSFDDIFRKANEFDDIEAIIILTDGDAPAPKIIPLKYRVIWGLTAGDRSYLTFGDKVLIGD